MPRGPRLDAPGVLHHVMVRGIERRRIFRSDLDRRSCLDRLGALIIDGDGRLYAWCLMPNHVHALIRTGTVPLSLIMRRWIGPYASAFNRRYKRSGHLFQNRYKSILVEEQPYLLELVRYIHLNPVRARLRVGIEDLDTYPWTGHAVLLGGRSFPAQDTEFVLAQFGSAVGAARQAYRAFVQAAHHRRLNLSGGGLRRSAGGWEHIPSLRRGRERWAHDERILGSSEFVRSVVDEATASPPLAPLDPVALVAALCDQIGARFDVGAAQIASRSLERRVLAARAVVCHLAVRRYGLSLHAVARCLNLSKQSVTRATHRAPALLIDQPDLDAVFGRS